MAETKDLNDMDLFQEYQRWLKRKTDRTDRFYINEILFVIMKLHFNQDYYQTQQFGTFLHALTYKIFKSGNLYYVFKI